MTDQAESTAPERRGRSQRAWFVAVGAIVVLNLFDVVTTYAAISMGADEGNPIVRWMISNRLVILFKILVCGGLILGAVVAWRRHRRVTLPVLCLGWFVVGVYSLVVVLNTVTVLSLR